MPLHELLKGESPSKIDCEVYSIDCNYRECVLMNSLVDKVLSNFERCITTGWFKGRRERERAFIYKVDRAIRVEDIG